MSETVGHLSLSAGITDRALADVPPVARSGVQSTTGPQGVSSVRTAEVAGPGFDPGKAEPMRLQRIPFDRWGIPPGAPESSERRPNGGPSAAIRRRSPPAPSPPER